MPRIKSERLERLDEIRGELERLAAAADPLKREAAQIEAEARADLDATGKPQARRGLFMLRFSEKRGSVAWKSEFVRVAGAEAATELVENAPTKRVFKIEKVAA